LTTYHTVLYLHLLSLLAGVAAASIGILSLFRLRSAQTLAEAAPWGMLGGKVGRVFGSVLLTIPKQDFCPNLSPLGTALTCVSRSDATSDPHG
jgi:hypothetical protein